MCTRGTEASKLPEVGGAGLRGHLGLQVKAWSWLSQQGGRCDCHADWRPRLGIHGEGKGVTERGARGCFAQVLARLEDSPPQQK